MPDKNESGVRKFEKEREMRGAGDFTVGERMAGLSPDTGLSAVWSRTHF